MSMENLAFLKTYCPLCSHAEAILLTGLSICYFWWVLELLVYLYMVDMAAKW